MPLKKCPTCQHPSFVVVRVCPCGHEFYSKKSAKKEPKVLVKKAEVVQEQKVVTPLVEAEPPKLATGISGNIFTPAGAPLAKPNGYRSNKWAWQISQEEAWENPINDEDIIAWVEECIAAGQEKKLELLPVAVRYWAKYFWPNGSDEHKRVCKVISSSFQND